MAYDNSGRNSLFMARLRLMQQQAEQARQERMMQEQRGLQEAAAGRQAITGAIGQGLQLQEKYHQQAVKDAEAEGAIAGSSDQEPLAEGFKNPQQQAAYMRGFDKARLERALATQKEGRRQYEWAAEQKLKESDAAVKVEREKRENRADRRQAYVDETKLGLDVEMAPVERGLKKAQTGYYNRSPRAYSPHYGASITDRQYSRDISVLDKMRKGREDELQKAVFRRLSMQKDFLNLPEAQKQVALQNAMANGMAQLNTWYVGEVQKLQKHYNKTSLTDVSTPPELQFEVPKEETSGNSGDLADEILAEEGGS